MIYPDLHNEYLPSWKLLKFTCPDVFDINKLGGAHTLQPLGRQVPTQCPAGVQLSRLWSPVVSSGCEAVVVASPDAKPSRLFSDHRVMGKADEGKPRRVLLITVSASRLYCHQNTPHRAVKLILK